MKQSLAQKISGRLADSILFDEGRLLYESNRKDFNFPMSKFEKLRCGGYLILKDYSQGIFPPTFSDQAKAYENEIDYPKNQPGKTLDQVQEAQMRKPFWNSERFLKYSKNFGRLLKIFESLGIQRGEKILELGCGPGWMAEFFALCGHHLTATTISHYEIQVANKRIESLKPRAIDFRLRYLISPMETVGEVLAEDEKFKVVYVFEALHHAYNWKQVFPTVYNLLEPGGWFILANEPNVLHTFISYRVAKLSQTHEIGLSRKAIFCHLKDCGFSRYRALQPKLNNFVTPHWIIAQKCIIG